MQIRFEDPLLIAVEKGEDIRSSNTQVIVGPCWGPDFDELALLALNLTLKKNQRKTLVDCNIKSLENN